MEQTVASLVTAAAAALDERELEKAEALYQQALKLQPGNAAAMLGLGIVYNRSGAPQQAKAVLQPLAQALDAPPKPKKGKGKKKGATSPLFPSPVARAEVYAQLALALTQLNELTEARSYFQKAHELVPKPQFAEAISAIERALAPKDPVQQIIAQASLWVGAGQLDKALHLLKEALAQRPEHPPLLHATAMVLRGLKQNDEAMRLMQLATVLDPDQPLYFNDLGMLFLDQQDHAKALMCYKRAVARDPQYAVAYSNMGVVYKLMGQIDEAVAAYRKALEINPNLAAAHNNLGNLLRIKGELAEAKKHLLQALELQPDYADAKANLAALLEEGRKA